MKLLSLFFGVLFLIFGLLFFTGKIYVNMLMLRNIYTEEKQKIKIKLLCQNIGELIILSSLIFICKGLFIEFTNKKFSLAILIWFLIAGFDLIFISKSKRYYKK